MSVLSTERFSDRVEDYVRYRPGYPSQVLDLLRTDCGLRPEHVVADIASGTGAFTRLLLENGNRVFGVEPNNAMREAGGRLLQSFPGLTLMKGTAEATTLPPRSVDFVTAAQAAHWFNCERARAEFVRILRPSGWCILVWNERRTESTPFLRDYERLLVKFGTDYKEVRHERTTATIREFFDPTPYAERTFDLRQQFDFEGTAGRLLSSSYAPAAGHPNHEPMMRELRRVFEDHTRHGTIEFEYITRVYYGKLK